MYKVLFVIFQLLFVAEEELAHRLLTWNEFTRYCPDGLQTGSRLIYFSALGSKGLKINRA